MPNCGGMPEEERRRRSIGITLGPEIERADVAPGDEIVREGSVGG